MKKNNEWTEVAWPYNSAITLPCYTKRISSKKTNYSTPVFLHPKYVCLDTEANDGYGSWEVGEGFQFSVKGQFSGSCPEEIKTLEEAKAYVEQYVPTKI
jgi:hypothetical protein